MGSSSDESDDDFVPEADEEQDGDSINTSKAMDEHRSGTTDSHLDKLWDDMNASASVSQTAAIKTSKLLNGLIKKTTRLADKKKKQKLHEFSIPILSVDVKRSRKDLAEETVIDRKMDRIIKFAGKEYTVASAASGTREKKGLDKVLESLDEPKKVSTMVKTSLDWDKFKEKEGIEDELTHYTKDGYLERQEFLQRLDLKRFELEKAERDKQRKLQQHSK
ncbi:putative SWR1-complex protein 5/Craniofacial development protein [Plasmopara halstedii]